VPYNLGSNWVDVKYRGIFRVLARLDDRELINHPLHQIIFFLDLIVNTAIFAVPIKRKRIVVKVRAQFPEVIRDFGVMRDFCVRFPKDFFGDRFSSLVDFEMQGIIILLPFLLGEPVGLDADVTAFAGIFVQGLLPVHGRIVGTQPSTQVSRSIRTSRSG